MTTERDFDKACNAAPHHIRQDVYAIAWGNAWAAETYHEYDTDADRWAAAIATAQMILDAPADYGLDPAAR